VEELRAIASKLALTNEQSTLFRVLLGRSERIARMYVGAIIALNDELDPERFCKAAHQMRELMEKISEIADVEIRALNERMGEKVAELETEFKAMVENSKLKGPEWDVPSDPPIRRCLNKTQEFFEWKANHQPKRREEIKAVLRALDGPRLPAADLEKISIDKWMEKKQFFVRVAHHQFDPVEADFFENVAFVQDFLLSKLNPRTFADFDAVDAIVEEGEGQ